ncbi:hypothetical protein QR680_012084 [Steinernema hermaphroditum]|uniref:Uncharacterized protein n=1 Tax=Steinernema hermaphroditum TaxID=289476 RepID=A0AA39I0U7_9BILA|nr:hypothetical protein QR680_012084 [Steinernema hermaphroditum]
MFLGGWPPGQWVSTVDCLPEGEETLVSASPCQAHWSEGQCGREPGPGVLVFEFCLHLPVTADWIHALITKWKQGNGLRLHRETKKMNVVLTSEDEWHKLEQICGAAVKHRRSTILSVEHVLEHRSLELEMQDGRQFTEIQIQHKSITLEKLEALVAEWRAGDSGTVVEGLRKIDVYISKPVWKKFTGTDVDRPILSHELIYSSQEQYVLDRLYADEADRFIVHHPRVNGRLIFKSLKHSSPKGFYLISSVPVDPMDVEDWNLALLFGSLEI